MRVLVDKIKSKAYRQRVLRLTCKMLLNLLKLRKMGQKSKQARWLTMDEACKIVDISRAACSRWIDKMNLVPDDLKRIEPRASGGKVTYLKHPDWAIEVTKKLDRTNPATKLYSESTGKFLDKKSYLKIEGLLAINSPAKQDSSPAIIAMSRKEALEAEKLELANQKARVDLAQSLGELVKVEDIQQEFKEKVTAIAQLLDDLPFKIAEQCQNQSYDQLLDVGHLILESLKEKMIEKF